MGLERTTCYGWCPSYTITIDGRGTVRYHGRDYVQNVGDLEGHIGEQAARRLLDLFEAAHFSELADEYVQSVTDCPSTYLTLSRAGRTKRVKNYWASDSIRHGFPIPDVDIHRRLDRLAEELDRAVDIEQWIGSAFVRDAAPGHFSIDPTRDDR
jgi:hypothetical protein